MRVWQVLMEQEDNRDELLTKFLSGEVHAAEQKAVEQMLAASEELRLEVARRQQQRLRLREAVSAISVPPSLRARLEPTRTRHIFGRTPGVWRGLQLAGALAMGLLLLVAGWQFFRPAIHLLDDVPPSVAAVLRIGAGKHVSCVKERIGASRFPLGTFSSDLSEEHRALLDAAQQALPSGYTLVERHLCGNAERRFAHLVMARDGVYLSVLITRRGDGDPALPYSKYAVARVDDISVYSVRHDGMDVGAFALPTAFAFVVTDPAQQESLRLSRSVAAAFARTQE